MDGRSLCRRPSAINWIPPDLASINCTKAAVSYVSVALLRQTIIMLMLCLTNRRGRLAGARFLIEVPPAVLESEAHYIWLFYIRYEQKHAEETSLIASKSVFIESS